MENIWTVSILYSKNNGRSSGGEVAPPSRAKTMYICYLFMCCMHCAHIFCELKRMAAKQPKEIMLWIKVQPRHLEMIRQSKIKKRNKSMHDKKKK